MKPIEFQVKQYQIAPGEHSWMAEEVGSGCDPIPLPKGGMQLSADENFVGSYPEIAAHLSQRHQIEIPLVYPLGVHKSRCGGEGDWTFRHDAVEVIVHDILRVSGSVEVSPFPRPPYPAS